jgi:FAD synthase
MSFDFLSQNKQIVGSVSVVAIDYLLIDDFTLDVSELTSLDFFDSHNLVVSLCFFESK